MKTRIMISDNIRKITSGVNEKTLSKVSLLVKSAGIVGIALCLGLLIAEAQGAIQKEFLKALSIAVGACILALMHHKQSVNQ